MTHLSLEGQPSASDPASSTRWVTRGEHRLHAKVHAGPDPTVLLLHGFPDDLHLYDRLVPHLIGQHRIVRFDFLGWGDSDKPSDWRYTAAAQTEDVAAVLDQLDLDRVVLVAHDASGPPAIDWALDHPDRVVSLVLLNTYYAFTPRLRRPPAIALYSTPLLRNIGRGVARFSPRFDSWLYHWQVGKFVTSPDDRAEILPQFYERFLRARPAFWGLNNDLLPTVISRRRKLARLKTFPRPVSIVFGADDPYLNTGVARWFAHHLRYPSLHLLEGARHYVQIDAPAKVALLIHEAAATTRGQGEASAP